MQWVVVFFVPGSISDLDFGGSMDSMMRVHVKGQV